MKIDCLERVVATNISANIFDALFKGCKLSVSVMCRAIIKKNYDDLKELEQRNLLKIYDELNEEQRKKPLLKQ